METIGGNFRARHCEQSIVFSGSVTLLDLVVSPCAMNLLLFLDGVVVVGGGGGGRGGGRARVCVCVCVRERERETACMCLCVGGVGGGGGGGSGGAQRV